jgi:hypothetical protein
MAAAVVDLAAFRRAREARALASKAKVVLEVGPGVLWAFFPATDVLLTPSEARRLAGGLWVMADHAEGRGA